LNWNKIKGSRNSNHIGVLSGLPGIIIALADYSIINPITDKPSKELKRYILQSFKILEESSQLTPTYCDGLAGYGYFLLKLKKEQIIDKNDKELNGQIDAILEETDEILKERISICNKNGNLDILHGLVGLGFYFIERKSKTEVNDIVKILNNKSSRTEEGYVYWKKLSAYDNYKTIIDMGNAHGISGNIFFLTKLLANPNILTKDSRIIVNDLIDNSMNFYASRTQNITDKIYSFFPSRINHIDFEQKKLVPVNSRLGWCYGDLGTLYTLLMTSIQTGRRLDEKAIVEKLVFVANRRYETEAEEHVIDAGFCHGTSGLAILFLNIYDVTNNEVFWEAANYWLKQTINKKNKMLSEGDIDYGFVIKDSSEKNYSILEGLSGVLVCYLKFLFSKAPISEELLMIKY
jgi:lantibiotic modifying enzyme